MEREQAAFAGAGTTLLVADRLQRDAIGIELNVDYTRMAMDRCIADAPLFTSFPPAEDPEESRIADLFAGDEYHELPPRQPTPFRTSDRYLHDAAKRNNGMPEAAE